MKTAVLLLLICSSVATSLADTLPTGPAGVAGHLDWPTEWTVLAPFERSHGRPSTERLKAVPTSMTLGGHTAKAETVQPEARTTFDFAKLWGEPNANKVAYVFLEFTSPEDQPVHIGMGADWWLQAWLDGEPLYDTLEAGNEKWPPSISNHIVTKQVTPGAHVLVVRFISGTGSSVLTLGGPDELRRVPAEQWKTVPRAVRTDGAGEKVVNGEFEQGGTGIPWIPNGWSNAPAPASFAVTELLKDTDTPLAGKSSLAINTLGKPSRKRRLFTRLALAAGRHYEISYKLDHRGGGNVLLFLRESVHGGPVYFAHILGGNSRGRYRGYHFIENPKPYLVIEAPGPAHVAIDDISIRPCHDRSKTWKNWREQRIPCDRAMLELSRAVVTPHTSWAKPYAGGTINVLTIMPRWKQRCAVELMQRFDMICDPIMFSNSSLHGKPYWVRGDDGDAVLRDPLMHAAKTLEQNADCMVIDYLNASAIRPHTVKRILQKVERGAGLVIVGFSQPYYPYKDGKRKEALAKYKQGLWAAALCPDNTTTEQAAYVRLGPVTQPDSTFYRYGKGRIAYLRGGDNLRGKDRPEFECRMAYLGKAILWASRRMPKITIESAALPGQEPAALSGTVRRTELPDSLIIRLNTAVDRNMQLSLWLTDSNNETVYRTTTTLDKGAAEGRARLPRLKAGTLHVNVQLKQQDRVHDWQIVPLNVTAHPVVKDIVLLHGKAPYTIHGEPINGTIVLERALNGSEQLEIDLIDADGHRWIHRVCSEKGPEVSFSFDTTPLVVMVNTLRARITDAHGVVSEGMKPVIVARPAKWHARRFDFGLWGGYQEHLGALLCKALRKECGIDFLILGCQLSSTRTSARANMRVIFNSGNGVQLYPGHHNEIRGADRNAPERVHCLTAAKPREKIAAHIKTFTAPAAEYAPLAYFLDHELDLLGCTKRPAPTTDVCFSPTCLRSLRLFLQKEYDSLSDLNACWRTTFEDWDKVTPMVLPQAVASNQIPRWIDHRRHMDRMWTDFSLFRRNETRKYDPHAEVITMNYRSGPTVNSSFSGIDYWLLYNEVIGSAMMPDAFQKALVRPARRHLVWQSGEYWHPDTVTADFELLRTRVGKQPWQGLLRQYSGYELYTATWTRGTEGHGYNAPSLVNADLSVSSEGRILTDAVRHIRKGIAAFVFDSRNDDSGIGLYYSRASEHACTAWQAVQQQSPAARDIDPRRSQFAFWGPSLRAVGRNFRSVSYGQVADGILRNGAIKLLVIPFSQAISIPEAEEIKAFVSRGGCVMADIRPGISDEHGRLYKQGLLDEVFGVRHDPAWAAYVPERGDVHVNTQVRNVKLKVDLEGVILGPPVEARVARVLAPGARPAFFYNEYGKGTAILLNVYTEQKADASARELDRLFEGLLSLCGIPRLFDMEVRDVHWVTEGGEKVAIYEETAGKAASSSIAADTEGPGAVEGLAFSSPDRCVPHVVRLVNGNIECLGVWYDHATGRGNGFQTVRIRPRRPGHVYDLRTNEYLGAKPIYEVTMPLEGLIAHAVVPYRIPCPVLEARATGDPSGLRAISCAARLALEPDTAERHALQFRLTTPDGHAWQEFNVSRMTKSGNASHVFRLPENAPAGPWTVTVREAISGQEQTANVTL